MTYYRMMSEKKPVGTIIKGTGKLPLQERFPDVEAALTRNKPTASPARDDCVFMLDHRDFKSAGITSSEGFVHELEPIGPVEKHDIYWVGVLQKRYFKDKRLRGDLAPGVSDDEIAKRYWTAVASDKPTWEHVSKEAKVLKVDDDASRVRAPGSLLDAFEKDKK